MPETRLDEAPISDETRERVVELIAADLRRQHLAELAKRTPEPSNTTVHSTPDNA